MSEQRMEFRAEVSRLLDIVVHSLYSEKEIFLRELVSNASDACDKLRYEAITRPELTGEDTEFAIHITVDPKARTITVADNGIGMDRDELIDNLGTIARSGTAAFLKKIEEGQKPDIMQIGQFGVGFYAAFMVSEMVEVVSKKAGSDEAWCWRSDGKSAFSVEEDDRTERGTEVRLYLKQTEDEFLNEERLRNIVHRYSDHIALPILIGDSDAPANKANALWLRTRSDITAEQYREFYHHVAHAFDEPAEIMHWKAEGKIEYTGLLFVPSQKPYDLFDPRRKHGVKLYVKRVFITDDAEGLVPPYLRFLRGIIDSEDLPLNVSREMLQHNPMVTKIRQGVVRRVLGDLLKKAGDADQRDSFNLFWENFGAVLKEGLYEDHENRDQLLKLVRFHSTHGDELVSLDEYVARMRPNQDAIYYINGDNRELLAQSPHLEGFKARGVEVLLLTDTVDDFWTGPVGEYDGKKLKSATRIGQELGKIERVDAKDTSKEKKKDDIAPEKDMASLIALMKLALTEKIKDVRVSERLTDSPVCLATDEGDIDIHLERFLKQHNQLRNESRRILELNAAHPLIRKMATRAHKNGADHDIQELTHLLWDQARLSDGETVADIAAFSRRLVDVMSKVV